MLCYLAPMNADRSCFLINLCSGISSDPASISTPGLSPKSDTTDEGRKESHHFKNILHKEIISDVSTKKIVSNLKRGPSCEKAAP